MKDLGPAKQILGVRITRSSGVLRLSQEEYVKKVLSRFSISDAKPMSTLLASHFKWSNVLYAFAKGSLMFAIVCTRPDIAHAVELVSRYMSNPGKQH